MKRWGGQPEPIEPVLPFGLLCPGGLGRFASRQSLLPGSVLDCVACLSGNVLDFLSRILSDGFGLIDQTISGFAHVLVLHTRSWHSQTDYYTRSHGRDAKRHRVILQRVIEEAGRNSRTLDSLITGIMDLSTSGIRGGSHRLAHAVTR
jgi:hypothetical protein